MFRKKYLIIVLMALIGFAAVSLRFDVAESWWNEAWSRRIEVTITEKSGTELVDYQVKVTLTCDADRQPDYGDIRFVDSDDLTELAYWHESSTDGSPAAFWIKIPFIPASGTKTIKMYFGNPEATSASDIHTTFMWGDDFQNPEWTKANVNPVNFWGAKQYIADGEYHMAGPPTGEPIAEMFEAGALKSFPLNYIAEVDVKPVTNHGGAYISPRYSWTEDKYEYFIDMKWSNAMMAKKLKGAWTNLGMAHLGYEIKTGKWYKLKSVISSHENNNRMQVHVNDRMYIENSDSDLQYTGLAFLAFYWGDYFHVVFDNFRVRQYAAIEPAVSLKEEERLIYWPVTAAP